MRSHQFSEVLNAGFHASIQPTRSAIRLATIESNRQRNWFVGFRFVVLSVHLVIAIRAMALGSCSGNQSHMRISKNIAIISY